jgi:SEC-C motif
MMMAREPAPVAAERSRDIDEGYALMIPTVAGEVDPEWPKEPLSPESNDERLKSMIAPAARAYRYCGLDRAASAEEPFDDADPDLDHLYPDPYVRAEPKIGRNEPCPCGSAKEFKKYCGSPDRGNVQ